MMLKEIKKYVRMMLKEIKFKNMKIKNTDN